MHIPDKIIHKNAFYYDVQKSEITFMNIEAEYNVNCKLTKKNITFVRKAL